MPTAFIKTKICGGTGKDSGCEAQCIVVYANMIERVQGVELYWLVPNYIGRRLAPIWSQSRQSAWTRRRSTVRDCETSDLTFRLYCLSIHQTAHCRGFACNSDRSLFSLFSSPFSLRNQRLSRTNHEHRRRSPFGQHHHLTGEAFPLKAHQYQ